MQYIDCNINPISRVVSYPGATIVQRDTNVEALRFHFSLDAEYELENDSIRIMVLKDGKTNGFNAENVRVETNDGGDEELVFEHTITTHETATPGQIAISVCGNQVSGNNITEAWHTLNMVFQVSSAAHSESDEGEDTPETIASNAEKIAALQTLVNAITSGRPIPVDLKSKMTDTSAIYLYTGTETGEQHNYWYYHDGTSWVPGSEYGGMTIDDELSSTSENAVQNKVIKANFDEINGRLDNNNNEVIIGGDITVWKNVRYNNQTHSLVSATDRITSPLMPLGNGFEIKSIASNWKIFAYFFSGNDLTSYLSYTQYTTAPSTIAKTNAKYVLISIVTTNSSTAYPSDANNYAKIKATYAISDTNALLKEVEKGVSYEPIPMEAGYIACNSATIDVNSITISGTYTHAVVPCQEGDKFTINGQGGGAPSLWAFISSAASNNRLTYASSNENRTNYVLTAPQNSAYLIINTSDGRISAKGISIDNVVKTVNQTITKNKVIPNKSILKKEPTIPIKLSWEDLFSIEKTRCIHADNFHRADNSTEIGRNGNDTYPMEYIEYHEDVTEENDIQVGISNNEAVAFNAHYVVGTTKQIMAVDATQLPYRFSVEFENECCVAFGIKDVDNYFSCTCTPNSVTLAKVGNVEGKWTVTSNTHNADISIVDFYVFENHVMVCVGGRVLLDNPIVAESSICGMLFQANKISDWKYKNFAVLVPDEWTNFGYDRLIEESGVLSGNTLIGLMETHDDSYSCTFNTEYKRFNSSRSLKFDLKYSDGTGRSEINFPIMWKKD